MTATIFRNKIVFYFLITYISLLLIWKIFLALALADPFAAIPLSLQVAVIVLLTIEHKLAKPFLNAWVIIFVLVSQCISIVAKLLATANGEMEYITSPMFAFNIFQFVMGLVMLYLAKQFIRSD